MTTFQGFKPSSIFKIIATGSPEELEEHLKSEPESIYSRSEDWVCVLHAALERNHPTESLALCEVLLRHKADPKHLNQRLQSVLHRAASMGLEDCVELILKSDTLKGREDIADLVNQKDDAGYTAADCAVQDEHLGILKRLHEAGANMHCQDENGMSLLHTAMMSYASDEEKIKEIIGWLIQQEVSLNQEDKDGRSPADYAVEDGQFETLKMLHAAGADLHCQDKQGMNLLHTAARCRHDEGQTREMILWLIQQGVSLDQEDEEGKIPADHIISRVPLREWLEGVKKAMSEKEALHEVLPQVKSNGISESAELSVLPRLRI